jgi:hypothetical protein
MPSLQEIFSRVQETKKKQRELKRSYRDSLENSPQYQELLSKFDELKLKKKVMVEAARQEFPQLERIKKDIESDTEMLADLALNSLIKGEPIELIDEYKNQYEPVLKVRFKKIK